MDKEWRPIHGFEGIYEISNAGDINSFIGNKKSIKTYINKTGYCIVFLCKNGTRKMQRVHRLVAQSFMNYDLNNKNLVINHKNYCKSDNNVSNLEIVTQRYNSAHGYLNKSKHSKYTGVSWDKNNNKWLASITINKKNIFLGRFTNEYDAHLAYKNKLKEIDFLK